MNTILNRIDRLMMAITFAEASEPEMAQECLARRKSTPGKRTLETAQMPGHQILPKTAH